VTKSVKRTAEKVGRGTLLIRPLHGLDLEIPLWSHRWIGGLLSVVR